MKKIVALCLTLVLSLCSLTAFAATLEDVQKAGKLVIATSPDFPPFESLGEDGEAYEWYMQAAWAQDSRSRALTRAAIIAVI